MSDRGTQPIATKESAGIRVLLSVLTPSAVSAIVEAEWGVEVLGCQVIRHGANFHHRVDLDDGPSLFRTHAFHPDGLPHLPFELTATTAAAAAGVRISAPRPARNGGLSVDVSAPEGKRQGVLWSWAPGGPATAADAEAYGRQLAALHQATGAIDSSAATRVLDVDYLVTSRLDDARVLLREIDGAAAWLDGFARQVVDAVAALPMKALDVGVVHGDAHLGNGHVLDGEVCLFDTEFLGIGWRAYDLATFGSVLDFGPKTNRDETYARFLRGYRCFRSIGDADLAAIPTLMAARWLWLLGHWARSESATPNAIWHAPEELAAILDLVKATHAGLGEHLDRG